MRISFGKRVSQADLLLLGAVPAILPFAVCMVWLTALAFFHPDLDHLYVSGFTLGNFFDLATSSYVRSALVNSIEITIEASIACLVLAYPISYYIAKLSNRKSAWVATVVSVFALSFVLKAYCLQILFAYDGPVNRALLFLGILAAHAQFLGTKGCVAFGCVYASLPQMILILVAAFEKIPDTLDEAASTCGAAQLSRLWRVYIPLSKPGLFTAILFTLPSTSAAFIVPIVLGQGKVPMLAPLIANAAQTGNWPQAAAISLLLLALNSIFFVGVKTYSNASLRYLRSA
ncbi:MAG: ABC transporter permease [Janthinobacterium lividum]